MSHDAQRVYEFLLERWKEIPLKRIDGEIVFDGKYFVYYNKKRK